MSEREVGGVDEAKQASGSKGGRESGVGGVDEAKRVTRSGVGVWEGFIIKSRQVILLKGKGKMEEVNGGS